MRTTMTRILAGAALLLVPLAGCGQEEAAPPSATKDSGVMPTDIGSKIGGAVNDTIAAAADDYAEQIKKQQSQVDALKTTATGLADEKLNQLISGIESKLDGALGKLDEIKTADAGSAKALGQEVQSLMGEAKKLYEQAMTRLQELRG